MNIRIVIADDHEVVRCGLRAILSGNGISIVGEAASGDEAIRLTERLQPQLVLLDVRLNPDDGLAVLGQLKADFPEMPVLMFSNYDNPAYIGRTVNLKAAGFMLKTSPRDTILHGIKRAVAGETTWTRDDLRRGSGTYAARLSSEAEASLTRRESEVLRHLTLGLTNKEIAESLHISYETVKEHVQHILHKLGLVNRTQAALWAVHHGVI